MFKVTRLPLSDVAFERYILKTVCSSRFTGDLKGLVDRLTVELEAEDQSCHPSWLNLWERKFISPHFFGGQFDIEPFHMRCFILHESFERRVSLLDTIRTSGVVHSLKELEYSVLCPNKWQDDRCAVQRAQSIEGLEFSQGIFDLHSDIR